MLNYEYTPLGGGAAPVTEQLSKELSKRGHKVDVVTMSYKDLKKEEKQNRISIYRVNSFRKKQETSDFFEMFFYIINGYLKCEELVKKKKYDLVHAHFIVPTGVIAYLLKKRHNLNYVITSHGSDVPGYNPDRFKLLHKLLLPFWKVVVREASYITTPSNNLKKLILKNYKAKVKPVPNGIDYKKLSLPKKENIILYSGRLFERKGVQYLLRAVDGLSKKWKIVIAGDGYYKKELEKLAKKIDAYIEFTGWISKDKLNNLYERASIFLLPSTEESFGLVIAEAMMYGDAIITTKGTACEEVVGNSGLLVRKKSFSDIKKQLLRLIKNKKKLLSYQKKALKKSEEYSWDNIIEKYLNVYQRTK